MNECLILYFQHRNYIIPYLIRDVSIIIQISECFEKDNDRVKMLVLFSGEDEQGLVSAAAGCLAILSVKPIICQKIVTVSDLDLDDPKMWTCCIIMYSWNCVFSRISFGIYGNFLFPFFYSALSSGLTFYEAYWNTILLVYSTEEHISSITWWTLKKISLNASLIVLC